MVYRKYGKLFFDWWMVVFVILIFSWLFTLILFLYVIFLEFPIFFKQKRIGKNNAPFSMWKFRTLSVGDRSADGRNNFWLGKFLRFTSLDELPQVWNVMTGEMSFIGPRPLPEEYLPLYSPEQIKRHEVKPGITGWAQVNGRHSISWQRKFELDVYYVNNLTFTFDLIILAKTLIIMLSFRKDVSLNEERFNGNGIAKGLS